jgi:hypothetical protein
MLTIENVEIVGMKHAIRGMRNPMNSWDLSDSDYCEHVPDCDLCQEATGIVCPYKDTNNDGYPYAVGPNDLKLMKSLASGGSVHAKYRRMIVVYLDITAPLYWWKEFDTYKVGTVANSCSTMHKIHAKEFTLDDFSHEHLAVAYKNNLENQVTILNVARREYNDAVSRKDPDNGKYWWWQMIQTLPTTYNQLRTVMLNYEVLSGIYKHRKDHKLTEWQDFCEWIETLPYAEGVIF